MNNFEPYCELEPTCQGMFENDHNITYLKTYRPSPKYKILYNDIYYNAYILNNIQSDQKMYDTRNIELIEESMITCEIIENRLNGKFLKGKGNEKEIKNFDKIYKDDLINNNKAVGDLNMV